MRKHKTYQLGSFLLDFYWGNLNCKLLVDISEKTTGNGITFMILPNKEEQVIGMGKHMIEPILNLIGLGPIIKILF